MYFRPSEEKSNVCELTSCESSNGQMASEKSGPYLCTGYDIFLNMEPCPMYVEALNYNVKCLDNPKENHKISF